MRRGAAIVALATAGLAVLGGGGVHAQPARPLDVGNVDLGDHPEVHATLTAPTELGGTDLPPGSVTVREGDEPRDVTLTRLGSDPLEVVLAVDTSGSMAGEPFRAARDAARDFVDRLPDGTAVGLVAFASEPLLAHPLTDDHDAVRQAVEGLAAQGETALYDAVVLAAQQFSGDDEVRRAVVVLSDGGDTTSGIDRTAAVDAVGGSGARMEVVELVTDDTDPEALAQLAEAGGGTVTSALDPSGLGAVYDAIAASLGNVYRVTWTSAAGGATPVAIRLEHEGVVAERRVELDLPGATPAEPEVTVVEAPTGTGWLLAGGLASVGGAILVAGLAVLLPGRRAHVDRLVVSRTSLVTNGMPRRSWRELSARAATAVDDALQRHGQRGGLDRLLEQAGVSLSAGEYVVFTASITFAAGAVGWVLAGPALAVVGVVVTAGASYAALAVRRDRRREAFSDQLSETLPLLAGSLRAGYGLLQAVDALSREAPEPTRTELRRVLVESRLGRDLNQALDALADRMAAEDFRWVVRAIGINREVGGDLAEVLDRVAGTIRERNQVQRQVRTLTAEGRLSAWVLLGLPFVMGAGLFLMRPDYMRPLTEGTGLLLVAAGGVSLLIGYLWIRVLCRVDY